MIIAVVQIPIPRRPHEAAIAAQTKSAPAFRVLAGKGLLRKNYLNGDVGGGGSTTGSRGTPPRPGTCPSGAAKKETFGAEPIVTYYETYDRGQR